MRQIWEDEGDRNQAEMKRGRGEGRPAPGDRGKIERANETISVKIGDGARRKIKE